MNKEPENMLMLFRPRSQRSVNIVLYDLWEHCATSQKTASLIPDWVIEFFQFT
jgi:hypothetical protein